MKNATARPVLSHRKTLSIAVSAAALAMANPANAIEFTTESGWSGSVTTTLTASSNWRAQSTDTDLVAATNLAVLRGAYTPATGAPTATAAAVPGMGGLNGITAADNAGQTDSSNLNYAKGDAYSRMFKFITDLKIAKGDMGALVRIKGWYDQAQNNEEVRWGTSTTGFGPNRADKKLSDAGLADLNQFDGLYLLDAFAYSSFDIANMPLQVRLGRQALNWGESVYFQGVNQISPLDTSALRRAGTEIKEALLPIWSLSGNLGLPGGMSLEGFYQFKWDPTVVDQCSSYWSPVESSIGTSAGACNKSAYSGNGGLRSYNTGAYVVGVDSPKPSDSGQWGVSFKFPIEAIDTEMGVYFMNIHSRVPYVGAVGNATRAGYTLGAARTGGAYTIGSALAATALAATPFGPPIQNMRAQNAAGLPVSAAAMAGLLNSLVAANAGPAAQATLASLIAAQKAQSGSLAQYNAVWEYPENLKIAGLSAATTLGGWSVAAELSHQWDIPVQPSAADGSTANLIYSSLMGLSYTGAGATLTVVKDSNYEILKNMYVDGRTRHGYDFFHKTQFQVNGVNSLPPLLGAIGGLFVGEVAVQVNNVPQNTGIVGQKRYGRGFTFGSAASGATPAALATALAACTTAANNNSLAGCLNEGYIDDFAWGYRMRGSLDYPAIFNTSWSATPSVFFAHDVKGYSMDSQMVQDRKTLSLGLRLSLNRVHNIDLNYTTYDDRATYDIFHDRDNYSIAYSFTF